MDCADEAALIRRALVPERGVGHVDFDLIHGLVDITFDETETSREALIAALARTGLSAHVADDPSQAASFEEATHHHDHAHGHDRSRAVSAVCTLVSGLLFVGGWVIEGVVSPRWYDSIVDHAHDPRASAVYALSAFAGLWPMWPRALAAIRLRRLDMHALVCVTVIGAAIIGEWSEGAAVAFLFTFAHHLESWSIERARHAIAALVQRGRSASLDPGAHRAAPLEQWIERFAARYTPTVTAAAVLVAIAPPLVDGQWSVWFYRALVFLVLACPCALVISTPVTMVAALTSAARFGVLVRGGAALERAASASSATREALERTGLVVAELRDGRLEGGADADVVFTQADDHAAARLVLHARRALTVVRQNVAIALLTKAAFLVTAPIGFAPLWMAVVADTGATVIVTLNGMRLLRSA
jgi:cation transport ATPase